MMTSINTAEKEARKVQHFMPNDEDIGNGERSCTQERGLPRGVARTQ
jgi:hypothetical protein